MKRLVSRKIGGVLNRLGSFGALIVGIVVLYTLILFLFPPDIITFSASEQKIVKHEIVDGDEMVTVEVNFCKNLPYTALKIQTYMEDGYIIDLSPDTKRIPQEVGCRKQLFDFKVPDLYMSGERVRVRRILTYYPSPFLPGLEESWVSEQFIVIK